MMRQSFSLAHRFGIVAGLAMLAAPVLAHPKVTASTPAAGAVTTAPKKITLQLSEKFEPKFTGIELMKADGTPVPVISKAGGKDGKTIEANVNGKLASGQYMVMWHAVGADGHRVKGDYNFTVR